MAASLCVGAFVLPINALKVPSAPAVEQEKTPSLLEFAESLMHSELAPLDQQQVQLRLLSERVREEFFRTEIPYGALIYREAKRNNLPPELVAAVVKAESDFRPRLVSNKNAIGLMQIIPSTGEFMGANDLFDPTDNVRIGTRYLRYLNRRFNGDTTLVLAAYNAGEGTVRRHQGVPPYKETRDYLRKISISHAEYVQRLSERIAERQSSILPDPAPPASPASLIQLLSERQFQPGQKSSFDLLQ
jgi:soluble lytic murein transglycosylase-like protein